MFCLVVVVLNDLVGATRSSAVGSGRATRRPVPTPTTPPSPAPRAVAEAANHTALRKRPATLRGKWKPRKRWESMGGAPVVLKSVKPSVRCKYNYMLALAL